MQNCKITVTYQFQTEELNGVINPFVLRDVFQRVVLLWIRENNKQLKFDIDENCHQWMENGPWYNTTI